MTEQYYKMTLSEAIAHYQAGDLTAKGLVHIYIKIRCKPGWTVKIDHTEVCPLLGIRKTAFYNAISRLKAEGSIDWEAPQGILVSLSTSNGFRECGTDSTIAESQSTIAESQSTIAESQSTIAESQSTIAESKRSKLLPYKGCGNSPDYYNTYSEFFSSLSQKQREKFLEFGLKKAAELPKGPTLPQKWVERNFKELYAEFSKQFGEAVAPSLDWANHPRRDEWLEEMFTKGSGAFIGLAPEQERSERLKFREWAKANNHI